MSDSPTPTPAPTDAAVTDGAAKPASGMPLTIGIAVVALALGTALGAMVLGPRLAAGRHAAPASANNGPERGEHGKGKGGKQEKASVYRVENIILNPAGSEGSHFIMASVAIEVADDKVEEKMRSHEDAIRDRIIGVLEQQTIEQLTAPGARDSLRQRIAVVVAPYAGSTDPSHVYLPQFVIQ